MARLPTVSGDLDAWGTLLNQFLLVAHNTNGTLIGGGGVDSIRYVSPTLGSDSNDGKTWGTCKASIAAAQSSLPDPANPAGGGGTIVLSGERHDVGVSGLSIGLYNPVNLVSAHGNLITRLTDASITGGSQNATLYSSGSPTQLVKFAAGVSQSFGGGIKGVTFDMSNSAISWGVMVEDWNNVVIEDCIGYGPVTQTTAQYLVAGQRVSSSDCSWVYVIRNWARNMGVCRTNATNLSQACNYWIVEGNQCRPGTYLGSIGRGAIDCVGGYGIKVSQNDIEQPTNDPITAIRFQSMQRSFCVGDHGESANTGSVFIDSVGSSGCEYDPIGFLAPPTGQILVRDDTGDNIVRSPSLDNTSTGYSGTGGRLLDFVTRPLAIHTGPVLGSNGISAHNLEKLPHKTRHSFSIPVELIDAVPTCVLTGEYWDGAAYVSWAPSDLNYVKYTNYDALTIDDTHKQFRLTFDYGNGSDLYDNPVLHFRITPASAGAGYTGTVTYTVEMLTNAGATSVNGTAMTWTDKLQDSASTEAWTFPLPFSSNVAKIRLTVTLPSLSGGKLMYLSRVAIYTHSAFRAGLATGGGALLGGQILRGRGAPETNVRGMVGDLYLDRSATGGITASVKGSGAALTGWQGLLPLTKVASAYVQTNVTTDRSYDANAATVDELADVLGTLISDLRTAGLLT